MLRLINRSLQIMHLDSWVQEKFNNFSRDVSLLNNLLSDIRVHENPLSNISLGFFLHKDTINKFCQNQFLIYMLKKYK